jgi:hypothetical protein
MMSVRASSRPAGPSFAAQPAAFTMAVSFIVSFMDKPVNGEE